MRFLRVLKAFALVSALVLFALALFVFAPQSTAAALRGVKIWWDILFPALFPFFVISEVLLGFGIVHFFGTLFDPLMRPLFRIPGIGGFVMAMGFASGYPVGARLTAQLWEQKLINREEGERLVAFTSTSDPIFLIGAVSVGFFQLPGLAPLLAISHYGGGILTGLLMRFHGGKSPAGPTAAKRRAPGLLPLQAFKAMHQARIRDGRPLGTLIRQAIETSLKLILVVGGLVVFFSVILELLALTHIMDALYGLADAGMRLAGMPPALTEAVVNGLFEVTLGAQNAAGAGAGGGAGGAALAPLVHRAAAAAFVLAWSGLSVHAQIVSLLTRTDLRYRPFFFARLLHAVLSTALVYLLWKPLNPTPARAALWVGPAAPPSYYASWSWNSGFMLSVSLLVSILAALLILCAVRAFVLWVMRVRSAGHEGKSQKKH